MPLSERAMIAAGFSEKKIASAKPDYEYESSKDEYSGVIVTDGDCRLAVSPQGRAYLPQVRSDGAWHCARPFLTKGELAFYLEVISEPWPDSILAVLADLPSNPSDYTASRPSEKGAG